MLNRSLSSWHRPAVLVAVLTIGGLMPPASEAAVINLQTGSEILFNFDFSSETPAPHIRKSPSISALSTITHLPTTSFLISTLGWMERVRWRRSLFRSHARRRHAPQSLSTT